ncbi:MAG TPA: hypothetical protein VFK86_00375 [Bauldia sp.]|nr:hypothetical protein [Bauldia sp.]
MAQGSFLRRPAVVLGAAAMIAALAAAMILAPGVSALPEVANSVAGH